MHPAEHNRNFVHAVDEEPICEYHHEYREYAGIVWFGSDVPVADGYHGDDWPVVADQVLRFPGGDGVADTRFVFVKPVALQ